MLFVGVTQLYTFYFTYETPYWQWRYFVTDIQQSITLLQNNIFQRNLTIALRLILALCVRNFI